MNKLRIPALVGWCSESELFDDFGIYEKELRERGGRLLLGFKKVVGDWDIGGFVVFAIGPQLFFVDAFEAREELLHMNPLPIFDGQWSWKNLVSAKVLRGMWLDTDYESVCIRDILEHEPPYEGCPEWL